MAYARQVELVDLSSARPLRPRNNGYTPFESLIPTTDIDYERDDDDSSPKPQPSLSPTNNDNNDFKKNNSSKPKPPSKNFGASSSSISTETLEDMYRTCLSSSCIDVDELRRIVWAHGIPEQPTFSSSSSWIRPLTWKLLTGYLPPDRADWSSVLASSRARYWAAVHDATIDPSARPMDGDHPLSDSDTSQWREFFRDADVRALISRDAQRTHADLCQNPQKLKDPLERILFVYAKNNPSLGYRQGMNELAAPFLLVFSEQVGKSTGDDASDVEADAYFCFNSIMQEMTTCYLPDTPQTTSSVTTTTTTITTSSSSLSLSSSLIPTTITESITNTANNNNNNNNTGTEGAGIGRQLRELQALLRIKDPQLEARLDKLGIDPRFYGLRWLRLWLSQEFQLSDCLSLWDSFLTSEVRLPWIRYVCIAMLIHIREKLLNADFTRAMKMLLHYPPCDVSKLLQIADRLRTSNAVIVRTARS